MRDADESVGATRASSPVVARRVRSSRWTEGADNWWQADPTPLPGPTTGSCSTTTIWCCPTRVPVANSDGCPRPEPGLRPRTFHWGDADWPGRVLPGAVFYELHIGTFNAGATFDAAIERLDHLVELGVTHVEILPVNAFNGEWNWGYDGVLWYAVHEAYGGPTV